MKTRKLLGGERLFIRICCFNQAFTDSKFIPEFSRGEKYPAFLLHMHAIPATHPPIMCLLTLPASFLPP